MKHIYISYYDGPYRKSELSYAKEVRRFLPMIQILQNKKGLSVDQAYEQIRNTFSSVLNYQVRTEPEESPMSKYVVHRDLINEFLPTKDVKMVILGTMASYVARSLDDKAPESYFYYHSGHNRFWDVLTHLYYGEKRKLSSIEEKMLFLDEAGIAVSNLVLEAHLKPLQRSDDAHLFEAYGEQRLTFKTISPRFKEHLKSVPVFFTCYRKKPIENLLTGFFNHNAMSFDLDKINFLHSPTRRSYEYIAGLWRESVPMKKAA